MENAEEIFHYLEEFSKRKPKTIPQELNEYLAYVARTGDPVYQWSLVKSLFKEKLLSVITDFYESSPGIDIPPYPNVDLFNYDTMKNSLLERLDAFTAAPFTVQRICELLTYPRKQYNRVDKFMRAIEKNILVVSTREPGIQRHAEPENGEPIVNGSDNNSEYNVDVEMEDMSWKDNQEQQNSEPQPSSSDLHISVDDIEARLKAKQEASVDTQEKAATQYESVTPPELNVTTDETSDNKTSDETSTEASSTKTVHSETNKEEKTEDKTDVEMKSETTLIIPEIRVDDAEMTEQKLSEQAAKAADKDIPTTEKDTTSTDVKTIDESSSESVPKDDADKVLSEVSTSSEESSSSSDTTDGNSNSPKTDEVNESSNPSSNEQEKNNKPDESNEPNNSNVDEAKESTPKMQSDDYSISDVKSELPQSAQSPKTPPKDIEEELMNNEPKAEKSDTSTENKDS